MFIDVDEIIAQSPDTTFFEFIGRRGCGKTYGVKRYCIESFLETGKGFLYVRRGRDEVKPVQLNTLFSDLEQQQPELFEPFNERFGITGAHVTAYGGFFWITDASEKRVQQIGAYSCIARAKQFKGLPHNDISTIFFDEVITEDGYYNGDAEPERFNQILYTVARAGNAVKVFLCGNPDQNIELCPYFYNLKLDYENLADNTILYFNSVFRGKKQKNNICFCKLAGGGGAEYLNLSVAGVFGDVESVMSVTGETKHDEYKKITPKMEKSFSPLLRLQVQTPVIKENGYHRALYAYIGTTGLNRTPCIFVYPHDKIKGNLREIWCIYDRRDMLFYDSLVSYRLTLTYFPRVDSLLHQIIEDDRIFGIDDFTTQTFMNILSASKVVV